jgi:hypothetical protein
LLPYAQDRNRKNPISTCFQADQNRWGARVDFAKIKIPVFFTVLILSLSSLTAFSIKPKLPVYIYSDAYTYQYHEYYIPGGWSGDVLDLLLDIEWTNHPQSGPSCLRFVYNTGHENVFSWVGVFWQYPSCNWGTIDAGLDLSEASQLTFWARGENGTEQVRFIIGGCYGVFSDTAALALGPLQLTKEWKKYTIPFSSEDMTHISWGFGFIINKDANKIPKVTIYLDNIYISKGN